MFTRAARPLFSSFTRTYCGPMIRDTGFNMDEQEYSRSIAVKSTPVTDENYFDVFDRDDKIPILVLSVDPAFPNPVTEKIKSNIETTHGKIGFAHFDMHTNPRTALRLKIGSNELAIVHRGICLATSGKLREERSLHDFISKYAWMLNV